MEKKGKYTDTFWPMGQKLGQWLWEKQMHSEYLKGRLWGKYMDPFKKENAEE